MNRKFRACLRPASRAGRLVRPPAWAGRLVRAGLAGVLAAPVVLVAALGTASPAMALGNGLLPTRTGLYALEVIFHKILRRFVGFFLLAMVRVGFWASSRASAQARWRSSAFGRTSATRPMRWASAASISLPVSRK